MSPRVRRYEAANDGTIQSSVSTAKQDGSTVGKSTTSSEAAVGKTSAEAPLHAAQRKSKTKTNALGSGESSAQSPPVFRRPSLHASAGGNGDAPAVFPTSGSACGNLGNFPKSSKAIFPLPDRYLNSYDDTWGAARIQGAHEGTDLMSPTGTPEYAITDGTLVPVSGSNADGWNTLGGYAVMLRADYSIGPVHAGDLFYYAHMNRKSPLPIGTRVRAGQVLGVVGDTGQGPEVTRGLFPSHLHLGWYDMSGARTNLPSGAMNPYPLLQWLKANGGTVAGGSKAKYCIAPQRQTPTPSTGGNNWPRSGSPGRQPDLDTGTRKAAPSPIVEKRRKPRPQTPNQHKVHRQQIQNASHGPVPDKPGNPEQNQNRPERPGAKPKKPPAAHRPAPHKPAGGHGKPLSKPVVRPGKLDPPANPATTSNHRPPVKLPGIGNVRPPHSVGGADFRRWLQARIQRATAQALPGKHKPTIHGPKTEKEHGNTAAKHKKEGAGRKSGKLDACAVSKRGHACKKSRKKESSGVTAPATTAEKTSPPEPAPVPEPASGGTTGSVEPTQPEEAGPQNDKPEKTSPEPPASNLGGTTESSVAGGDTTSK